MSRTLLCCLTLGAAGVALTATSPIGAAALAGLAVGEAAKGAAGGLATDLFKALDRRVAARWFDRWRATDENHVVEQALRKAQLHGLRKVLERFDAVRASDNDETRVAAAVAFSARLGLFLDEEDGVARRLAFAKAPPDDADRTLRDAVLSTLPEAYDLALATRRANGDAEAIGAAQAQTRALTEAVVLAELRLRLPCDTVPPLFMSAFAGDRFPESWFDLFIRDAAATQKQDGEFDAIWQAEQVALIKAIQQAHGEVLERIERKIDLLPDVIIEKLLLKLGSGVVREARVANVDRDKIVGLARRIRDEVEDFDQALAELERAVKIAVEVQRDGRGGSNLGDFVNEVLRRVAEKSAAGAFDAAAKEVDNGFADWEQRRAALLADGIKLLEAGLKQDILRRNPAAAAERIARMAALEHSDRTERLIALSSAWEEWRGRGLHKGLNFDLEVAIEIARHNIDTASNADERGLALNQLGISLQELGSREKKSERLEEAAETYRLALEQYDRELVPLKWATTQNNLGNALLELSDREREGERKIGRLREAVSAYRLTLEKYDADQALLEWVMTQNNLGSALLMLSKFDIGTCHLEEAITIFRTSLSKLARNNAPLVWAGTQNNFGNALKALGEREGDIDRLSEAITAYSAALEEYTAEGVPLDWAMSVGNRGIAMMAIANQINDRTQAWQALEQIETAFETTRDSGHAVFAGVLEIQLLRARALVARLGD